MQNSSLAKFVGQSIVFHHVSQQLKKGKKYLKLVFVIIQQLYESLNYWTLAEGSQMFGSLG